MGIKQDFKYKNILDNLDKKLKNKCIEKINLGDVSTFSLETVYGSLSFFQLADNVIIARESYDTSGKIHTAWTPMGPLGKPKEYHSSKYNYYLIKDGKLVSEPKGIKRILKDSLGVEIASLNFGTGLTYSQTAEFVTQVEKDGYKIDLEDKLFHKQPNEAEIASQINSIQRKLKSSAEEFGFKNVDEFLRNGKNLKDITDKLQEEYKKHEKSSLISLPF